MNWRPQPPTPHLGTLWSVQDPFASSYYRLLIALTLFAFLAGLFFALTAGYPLAVGSRNNDCGDRCACGKKPPQGPLRLAGMR